MRKMQFAATVLLAGAAFALTVERTSAQGSTKVAPASEDQLPGNPVLAARAQFAQGNSPGQEVFNRNCAACHANGIKFPGTVALDAKYGGTIPGALELRKDLTPEMVRYFVRNGISIMPGWRKSQMTDKELDDLSNYLAKKR